MIGDEIGYKFVHQMRFDLVRVYGGGYVEEGEELLPKRQSITARTTAG